MNPLGIVGKALRSVAGILTPMFVRAKLPPALLWMLHILVIALITVGLWFVQRRIQKDHPGVFFIESRFPFIRDYWLSILFLVIYFLAWQAWWLWTLFQPVASVSPFPDINEAWEGVLHALEKAGIGIGDTPVFVVIGQKQVEEASLFARLPRGLMINGAPNQSAPLRVYANREAIYLTCPGICLLGIEGGPTTGGEAINDAGAPSMGAMDRSIGINNSIGMSQAGGEMIRMWQEIVRKAQDENRPLTDAEKDLIRQLSDSSGSPDADKATPRRSSSSVLQNAPLVEEATERMRFFCSLIAQSRWPLCPINGAIVLVSTAAAETKDIAQQTGLVAQRDLSNLIGALRLRFPVHALFTDLGALPGAGEFIRRFPLEKRQLRLGKSFPLNPDLKPSSAAAAIEKGVTWVFASLLPYWVYKFFRLETPNVESPQEAIAANGRLFQFLAAVKSLSENAASLVSRAVMPMADEAPSFGGCYLTATEHGGSSESLFLQDFFKKIESTQGWVAWTDAAFDLDAGYRSRTKKGYTVLVLAAAAVAALAFVVIRKHLAAN